MRLLPHLLLATALVLQAQAQTAPLVVSASTQEAAAILKTSGVQGGIVVQLGVGNGSLTAALQASDAYQVQGLDPDPQKVAAARETIRATGKYGPVAVSRLKGPLLPYIDNLVNLVVAEDLGNVSRSEALRVLVPNGVLLLKKKRHLGADRQTQAGYLR